MHPRRALHALRAASRVTTSSDGESTDLPDVSSTKAGERLGCYKCLSLTARAWLQARQPSSFVRWRRAAGTCSQAARLLSPAIARERAFPMSQSIDSWLSPGSSMGTERYTRTASGEGRGAPAAAAASAARPGAQPCWVAATTTLPPIPATSCTAAAARATAAAAAQRGCLRLPAEATVRPAIPERLSSVGILPLPHAPRPVQGGAPLPRVALEVLQHVRAGVRLPGGRRWGLGWG